MRYIVTFHTIADAMHMEQAAKKAGIEGRVIPVPRELSSGCGISWASPPEEEEKILRVIEKEKIEFEDCVFLK